jgi:hypothetical protein|nr:MAG TPA: YciI-related domain protein [Caudoviricetes sp.]
MKQLYIVNDIPEYEGDGPNYFYVVRANDYKDAIEIVKSKTGRKKLLFEATLVDNNEVWE